MTDFNTNTETNIDAVETTTEASTEAKATKEITTAKHARFLAEAARKRAEKFRTQATEADETAAKYDELAATLPESNPSSGGVKARPVLEVGTSVTFRFGRTTSTSKARILDGVVKARKDEDGYYFLTGRKKNLIILDSGENISPEELEGIVGKCEAVKECVVKEMGKKIGVVVYCDEDKQQQVRDFITEANRTLPLYKRMSAVEFSTEPLPRNGAGKLLRQ